MLPMLLLQTSNRFFHGHQRRFSTYFVFYKKIKSRTKYICLARQIKHDLILLTSADTWFQIFFVYLPPKADCAPQTEACRHKDLFCSISDTNYHLEKRNNSKSTHNDLLERAPHSAGFIHRIVGGCGRPVSEYGKSALSFFKDDVMACHREKPYY